MTSVWSSQAARYDRRANRSWTGARRYRTVEDMSTSTAEGQRVTDLHGQRVVILGGTSGIGLATAKAVARYRAAGTVLSPHPATAGPALSELPPNPPGR